MDNKVYYGEYSLKHWIDLILSKNLVLPDYQRYFVWDKSKIIELIKSLKEKKFIPPITIGYFHKNEEDFNFVIDGQQRLTSLLLIYLGIYPNKEKFRKEKEEQLYNSSLELDLDLEEEIVENFILEWSFKVIQEAGKTKKEILDYIRNNSDLYNEIDLKEINITDDFFEENYLGFSYLVPDNKDEKSQQEYYSSVFRSINIQGQTLLPQESRKALYYLNKDIQPLFDPKFISNYKIKTNNGLSRVDFIRYLSLLTQYKHKEGNVNLVAKGEKSRIEKFYEEYIYSVISGDNELKFGSFIDIFNSNYTPRLNNLKKHQEILSREPFTSIIDVDMYFFGLVYHTLFENKEINLKRKKQLISEIDNECFKLKKNDAHLRSPNSLKYLRERITTSINVFEKYIK